MALSKSTRLLKDLQVAVTCEMCQSGEHGQHYCTVCNDTLCESCKVIHGRISSCKNHKVIPRSEIASVIQSNDLCTHHSSNMVVMECQTCNVLVCIECVSDKHKGHAVVGIAEVYEREKAVLEKKVKEMEQHSLATIIQAITSTIQKKDGYRMEVESIKKEMERELNELKEEADRINEQRLKKLEEIENTDLTIIDEIESKLRKQKNQMENIITECKTIMTFGSQAELIMYSKQSCSNQQVDLDTTIPNVPQFYSRDIKTSKLSNILGKLKVNTTYRTPMTRQVVTPKIVSSFRSGLKGRTSLCMENNGTAWIGGYKSRKLNLVDINGKIIRNRTIENRPCCLAITDNGEIIMSSNRRDSKAVMKLRVDGTEEVVYDASPSCCNGVSVTRDQEILICTSDKGVMMYDGTNTRQIYKGTNVFIHAVGLPDKKICVSDDRTKQVLVLDRTGRLLKSFIEPLGRKNFDPSGMTVDVMNNILVTDYNNHCVYLIGANEEVIEFVGKSHGVEKPCWISIDKYNNLWIGQEDGNVKVVRNIF